MAPRPALQRRNNYAQVSSSEEDNGRIQADDDNESNRVTGRTERNHGYNRLTRTAEDDDVESHNNNTTNVDVSNRTGRQTSRGATATTLNRSNADNTSESSSVVFREGEEGNQPLEEEEDQFCNSRNMSSAPTLNEPNPKRKDALVEEEEDDEEDDDRGNYLTVIILDVAQKKFNVPVPATATIATLKSVGSKIHKISSDRQRLIFRGKMMQDDDTLAEAGITADRTIVHLFPKPRVVIKDSMNNTGSSASSTNEAGMGGDRGNGDGDEEDGEQGARVPTIVLDADEAERRSQILVLGSTDYLEAQNNVKLFSFMLLIISSIELMNLLAVLLGVPQQDGTEGSGLAANPGDYAVTIDDDIFAPSDDGWENNTVGNNENSTSSFAGLSGGGGAGVVETWEAANWVDLIISAMGVYVGILGLQATTHNTLRLAKSYLIGTVTTGVAWMVYNFVMTYEVDKEQQHFAEENAQQNSNNSNDDVENEDLMEMSDGDIRWQAVSVMVLPGFVWFFCCLRAWQFQHLLREAEQEAAERIRSEFAPVIQAAAGDSVPNDNPVEGNRGNVTSVPASMPNHDEELALQNASARIS